MDQEDTLRATMEKSLEGEGSYLSSADRLCVTCVGLLPVDGAALTIAGAGSSRGTFGSSGALSRLLDELEFTFGEGPARDSVRTRHPVLVADLQDPDEQRWPAYNEAVLDLGVRAVYALPVCITSGQVGALSLYRHEPGPLCGPWLAGGLIAAEVAALPLEALLAADVDWDQAGDGGATPTPTSLERVEVYQATGMVMGQLDVSADEALIRLRGHAFAHDMTASEVAWSIIERRLRLDRDHRPPPPGTQGDRDESGEGDGR